MTTMAVECAPAVRTTRSLLGYGVIAGPLYVTVSLAQLLTRDGFDPTRDAWSTLASGRLGWIQMTNLVVSGLMVLAAAVGVRRAVGRGWPGLAVYGAGMVVAGFFRADPSGSTAVSWHGLVHFAAAGVGFAGLVVAGLRLARVFGGWRSRAVVVFFAGMFLAMAASGGAAWGIVGFSVAVVAVSAWLSALSVHLYRTTDK